MTSPNTILEPQSTSISSEQPWHINLPDDLPPNLIPAYSFINAELTLHPCMTPPVDHMWLDHIWILDARNPVSLEERKKSLQTIMRGLRWRFDVQQKIILVWKAMLQEGLVKKECVELPVNMSSGYERSDELTRTLLRFEYLDQLKGYGGSWGKWDDGGLRGQFEEPVVWLAVMILRSNATKTSITSVVRWIEENNVLGVLRDEEVQEARVSPEPEYGWIDEDGIGFNDDEEFEDAEEEEKEDDQARGLISLFLYGKGDEPGHRIGMIMSYGQDLRMRAEGTLERPKAFKQAFVMSTEDSDYKASSEFSRLLESFAPGMDVHT